MTCTEERRAKRYGYGVVIALVLTSFIPLSMALSCAGIFYPYVSADLGVGTGVMSYYTVFIWFSATVFLSFLGKLLYKMDARIILLSLIHI